MTERDIFMAAVELDDPARTELIESACAGDPAKRGRVLELIAAHLAAGSFLGPPPAAPRDPDYAATKDFSAPAEPEDDEDGPDALAFFDPPGRPDSLGRIGHYEVLQVLGRGAFGTVYRAFDDMLQRVVAVKVLAPQMAATSPARKRFVREARSSAQVRHENVVQVYEVGEKPLPYLVMEFIPGETLQQRLDRTGPVDALEVVRVGRQIADGLAAAHGTDLIHRDIKPGNILLEGGAAKVKITDFGLARAADDASISQSGLIAGTPMYMAPEQAKGEHLDHRADLFSLGSVLYQMLAGRPPFRAANTVAVLKRVCEDTPRPIREIIPEAPQWLCDIIAKLHAKDPAQRFQSAREVADLLAECEVRLKASSAARGFPAIAPPALVDAPTVAYAPENTETRRPRWKWGLVAGLLAAAAVGTVAVAYREPVALYATNRGELVLDDVDPDFAVTIAQGGAVIHERSYQHSFRVPAHGATEIRVLKATTGTEVFRTDVAVRRGTRVHVNVARELAAAEDRFRKDVPNDLAKLGQAVNEFGAEERPNPPAPPPGYTGVPAKALKGNPACLPHQYSPDGKWLAAQDHGGNYATFRVWDARTGEPRLTRDVRNARVPEFSPDGRRLAVPEGSAVNCHIVVFDTATFEEVKRWPCDVKAARVVYDRTGKILAARDGDSVALYDSETGKIVTRLESTNAPNGMAFSPTADLLAVEHMLPGWTNGEGRWVSDARVVLYDVDPKSPTYKKALHTWDAPDTGDSHQLRFSPDGARLAFTHGTKDNRIGLFVYDTKTGKQVAKFVPAGRLTQIGVGPFLPDGRTIPVTFGEAWATIALWDSTAEKLTRAWTAKDRGFHPTLVVDPTGKTLCTGGTKTAEPLFFDLATGQELVPGAPPAPPAVDPELARVAALPPLEQVEEVRKLLIKRNPKFDGALAPTVDGNTVVKLEFWTDNVTDVAPVRLLAGLKALAARGTEGRGQLTDLSPLKGLALTTLDVNNNGKLADLTPVKGMPLKELFAQQTAVRDLTPLAGARLEHLNLSFCPVADLAPLKDMPLVTLYLDSSQVTDLTPLKGVPLKILNIRLLKLTPARDHAVLRGLTALESINGDRVADFLKAADPMGVLPFTDADAKRIAALPAKDQIEAVREELKKRNPKFDGKTEHTIEGGELVGLTFSPVGVTDLSPLRGVPTLRELGCAGGGNGAGTVADLTPLKGLKLTKLSVSVNPIADLSPLKGMPLTELHIDNSQVADLAPLAGMPLKVLNCSHTRVSDLIPLKAMPLVIVWTNNTDVADLAPLKDAPLEWITFQNTKVKDTSVLKGKSLSQVYLDFDAKRDADLLRGITTLEKINDQPAAEFLKANDK